MTPLPVARRASYHGTVGPRRQIEPVPDLTCLVCGTPCVDLTHHRDAWRDAGHTPKPCAEVPAGSEAQRVMGQRAGGPTPTDLQPRRLNGARSW